MLLCCLVPSLLVPSGFSQAEPGPAIKKPLIYQIGQMVHINAAGSRPLLQAVDALQQKYAWIVDYEDPQYLSSTRWCNQSTVSSQSSSSQRRSDQGKRLQCRVQRWPYSQQPS